MPWRVAIIGGGLTGLAAAHRLCELCPAGTVEITLFERGPRLGGLVGTVERDGYLIDTGADSFITNKPGALGLCTRLGLGERLQSTESRYRGALVLHDGQPVPVPEGFQLLSPSVLWPTLCSPILSPWGKLRLACEWLVPRRSWPVDVPLTAVPDDESLAAFVRRRLGREALEQLVQPLVGGIYTSDPERLSLAATMPRFLEMERDYGGLLRAARATTLAAIAKNSPPRRGGPADDRTSSGARYGLFAGLRGGMQDLVDALVRAIQPRVTIRLQTHVSRCEPLAANEQGWRVTSASASSNSPPAGMSLTEACPTPITEAFDAVIVTTPAFRAAELITGFDAPLAALLAGIDYASSAIVVSGYPLANVRHPLNAFGLVIPHRERRRILAVSFSSRKFPNRAPEGRVLLRTFVGGAMQPDYAALDDSATCQLVREELAETLGVRGAPDFEQVVRYPRAMPQFHVGHVRLVQELEAAVARWPGLELAGNAYHGVGVPDAIHSGEQAAARVASRRR